MAERQSQHTKEKVRNRGRKDMDSRRWLDPRDALSIVLRQQPVTPLKALVWNQRRLMRRVSSPGR